MDYMLGNGKMARQLRVINKNFFYYIAQVNEDTI